MCKVFGSWIDKDNCLCCQHYSGYERQGSTCLIKCTEMPNNTSWALVSCCERFREDDESRRLLNKWIETEGLTNVHPDVIKLMKIKEEK